MKRRGEEGQAVYLVAVGLTLLMLAAGLAIDIGYLRYQKRRQQSAADSAAIAGASEINYGDRAGISVAARTDSASNGYTDGSDNVTVTVYNPPNDGPYTGVADYVEVLVTKIHPTFFAKVAGFNTVTVTAQAVAHLTGANARNCLYALGRGIVGVVNYTTVNAPNCGIIDNGNLQNIGTINATEIGVAGTVISGGSTTSTPVTGMVPAADPLSYLQPPAAGGGCLPNPNITLPGTYTLPRGNYCNGITVQAPNVTVNLNRGMYTITGEDPQTGRGVTLSGTGTVIGTGVTLYLGPSAGGVLVNGLQTVLVAPTTGNYAGILFYQDPSNISTATINGGPGSKFEGALYFPSAQLTINGTGSGAAYTIAVARYLSFGSSVLSFPADYSSLPNGSPIKDAILGE